MRRVIAAAGAATVALCLATSPGLASAASPAGTPAGPGVEKSRTGSYIVVMKADPLVKSMKVKDLDSATGKRRKAAIRATHDVVLERSGVSTSRKTTDYTTAVNGFAVRTDLRGAEKIAHAPGVALVLPDELRQPTALSSDDLAHRGGHGGGPGGGPGHGHGHGDDSAPGTNGLNTFLGLTGKGEAYAEGITGRASSSV